MNSRVLSRFGAVLRSQTIAHERWVAISVLGDERISFDLATELARRGINDSSYKVRLFAVDKVLIRYIITLLPDLKERALIEKDRRVAESIKWVVNTLDVRGDPYYSQTKSLS